MQLPPPLETKFNELAGRYPVKRSALIPMMLYAQDQFGFLGDEILEEIAKRLDLNMHSGDRNALLLLDAAAQACRASITFRSAPTFPACCAAATSSSQHVKKRLGIGNKEVSESGIFSLEEVECIGACTGAPAMQVNYDFYEDLDADKVDAILEQLRGGEEAAAVPVISRRLARTRSRRSRRDQQALRHARLARKSMSICKMAATRRSKKR